ncbi:MAG: hypothetical protein IPP73_18655 [Chitinophagaceae bacterium]|nr:hypothetical protein [Chitinophagaceae bacterium]
MKITLEGSTTNCHTNTLQNIGKIRHTQRSICGSNWLVGMGHRVADLLDFDRYKPEFPVQSGSEYVCLPYLAAILRLADELDITNDRTPELLFDEYLPDNKVSKRNGEA